MYVSFAEADVAGCAGAAAGTGGVAGPLLCAEQESPAARTVAMKKILDLIFQLRSGSMQAKKLSQPVSICKAEPCS